MRKPLCRHSNALAQIVFTIGHPHQDGGHRLKPELGDVPEIDEPSDEDRHVDNDEHHFAPHGKTGHEWRAAWRMCVRLDFLHKLARLTVITTAMGDRPVFLAALSRRGKAGKNG